MNPVDFLRAAAVGLCVLVSTLLFSIPMVAIYAYLIHPGEPQAFYTAAAQWIAPWSSHILGPLLFLWLNYRGAVRRPQRNAIAFACATITSYFVIDIGSLPLFGSPPSSAFTLPFLASLAVKTAGALTGATLGARRMARNAVTQGRGAI